MKKLLFLLVFLPLVSFGQKPVSDKYIFNGSTLLANKSNIRTSSRPMVTPDKWFYVNGTEVDFNWTELYEGSYDADNEHNPEIRWVLRENRDKMSTWHLNRRNYNDYSRGKIIKLWGQPPTAYFFYDDNIFRDNAMVVLLESSEKPALSLGFKKSDLEPLAFSLFNIINWESEGFNEQFKAVFIFNDNMSTKIEMELSGRTSHVGVYPDTYRNSSDWKLIDPNDKFIKSLKQYSYVDIMLDNGQKKKYSRIPLKGSTSALNRMLGIVEPTRKNSFEYAYNFGLANFNPFDWEGYVYKFLDDAKINHGINLDYVKKSNILTVSKRLEGRTIALAAAMNNDKEVIIAIDPDRWLQASPEKRWYIIYHELGHDILNFEHGTGGPMMYPETSGSYDWSRLEKDKTTMFSFYKSLKQN